MGDPMTMKRLKWALADVTRPIVPLLAIMGLAHLLVAALF